MLPRGAVRQHDDQGKSGKSRTRKEGLLGTEAIPQQTRHDTGRQKRHSGNEIEYAKGGSAQERRSRISDHPREQSL